MRCLYVLYDEKCGVCACCREWLERQEQHIPLLFIGVRSNDLAARFPGLQLPVADRPDELVVVSDDGDVYRGDKAWLMVLWALRRYRAWSYRLARPLFRGMVSRAVHYFSSHRDRVSDFMQLQPDDAILVTRFSERNDSATQSTSC